MNLNEILRACDTGEALLAAHTKALGSAAAPGVAEHEFARIVFGALEEACEQRRALVAEVKRLRDPMPCGHPRVCLVPAGLTEGTMRCAWCADLARWKASLKKAADVAEGFRYLLVICEEKVTRRDTHIETLRGTLGIAANNAEDFREMFIERERKVAELKAAAKLDATMLARQCDLAREAESEVVRLRDKLKANGLRWRQ